MSDLLDTILAHALWSVGDKGPRLYGVDPMALPVTYKGWVWPLRVLVALRYLVHKEALLRLFHSAGRFPLDRQDLTARLHQRVRQGPQLLSSIPPSLPQNPPLQRIPLYAHLLRTLVLALLAVAVLGGAAFLWRGHTLRIAQHEHLGQMLLRYADLAHLDREARVSQRFIDLIVTRAGLTPAALRKEGQKRKYGQQIPEFDGPKEAGIYLEKISEEKGAKSSEQRQTARSAVLALFPRDTRLQKQLAVTLDHMAEDGHKGDDIIADFATVNHELDRSRLGYRLVPTILGDSCSGYLGNIELRALAERTLKKGQLGNCMTTLALPYEVESYEQYRVEDETFAVYRLRHLGALPVIESALGLTYRNGRGSDVFLDRIHVFVSESLLPSLSPRGRTLMFPWTRGSTDIETLAAAAVEKSLRRVYRSELEMGPLRSFASALVRVEGIATRARMHQAMMSIGHGGFNQRSGREDVTQQGIDALTGFLTEELDRDTRKSWPQPPEELDKLESKLAHAVAYHEVQHQLTERQRQIGRREAKLKRHRQTLGPLPDIDGTLDEVGAYLVGMYYAQDIRHIVLTQLASFALSTVAEGGREYFAGRILLRALAHSKRGASPPSSLPEGPLDVVHDFTVLAGRSDEDLAEWAQAAYQDLFGERLPDIELTK